MLLRPNDLPELVEGEIRRVTCKLSGAVGINSINTATATCDNLAVGTPSINGTEVSFLLTASQVGTHTILVSADLSSSETIKGKIRAKVQSATSCSDSAGDY
jgi:hypothetical protein